MKTPREKKPYPVAPANLGRTYRDDVQITYSGETLLIHVNRITINHIDLTANYVVTRTGDEAIRILHERVSRRDQDTKKAIPDLTLQELRGLITTVATAAIGHERLMAAGRNAAHWNACADIEIQIAKLETQLSKLRAELAELEGSEPVKLKEKAKTKKEEAHGQQQVS